MKSAIYKNKADVLSENGAARVSINSA